MGFRTQPPGMINLLEQPGVAPQTPAQLAEQQAAQHATTGQQAQPMPGETPAQYQQRMASGGQAPAGTITIENPMVRAVQNIQGGQGGQGGGKTSEERGAVGYVPPPGDETSPNWQPKPGMGTSTTTTSTQTQTQKGLALDPKIRADLRKADASYTAQLELADKESKQIMLSMDKSPIWGAETRTLMEGKLGKALAEDENVGDTMARMRKAKDSYDRAIQEASGKVDPNQFWNQRDTGDRIMAGLAIFLGGLGAGPNGQNMALKIIDDAIARDINSQEFNIEQSRKEAAMLGESLRTEADLADWKAQTIARTVARYDAWTEARATELNSRMMGSEQKTKLAGILATLAERRAKVEAELAQMTGNRITETITEQAAQKPYSLKERREISTPWGFANDRESAKSVRLANTVYMDTTQILDELTTAVKTIGTTAWDRQEKGRALALATAWSGLMTNALKSGTLGESEYARYLSQSPISPDYFDGLKNSDEALALINQTRTNTENAAMSVASSYIPVDEVRFPNVMQHLNARFRQKMSTGFVPTPVGK